MNLITVIVPMYNEKDNVKKCVNCLKSQTNQNFDVIFIDDGSTDDTIDSLNKYLVGEVTFNYEILKQKNLGAAAAREKGIKASRTEFIVTLDCDDEWSDNLVEKIYTTYKYYKNVDIIIPGMKIQNKNKTWEDFLMYTEEVVLNPFDCIFNSLNGWKIHGCYSVRKSVIEKSYLNYRAYNINNDNYVNNDEVITRLNFLNSKTIIKCDAYYYYCYNFESTTKKVDNKRYLILNNSLILYRIFSSEKKLKVELHEEFVSVLWGVFRYMHDNKDKLKNLQDWKFILNERVKWVSYSKFFFDLSYKRKIQLTFLKLLYLF